MKEDDEMGRTITEMVRDVDNTLIEHAATCVTQKLAQGHSPAEAITLAETIDEGTGAMPDARADATDPLQAGIRALRAEDPDALRIWTVKGPKEIGGTISAVLLQGSGEIVILNQLPSGRFGVFVKRGAQ